MKNKITFLVLLVTTTFYGQDYKFGKVSKEELAEQFYRLDSVAGAAYLVRERNSYYQLNGNQDGFDIISEIHYRIKIYNKTGFEKATIAIPYYHPEIGENEKISSLKAYTFNLDNGKIQKEKLNNEDVFTENVNKYWSKKTITMPNIKEGSVIDIKYKLLSPYYSKIDDMDFQFEIPVKHLEYFISIPEFYKFKILTKGFYPIAPQITKKNSSVVFTSKSRSGSRISTTSFSRDEVEFISAGYNFIADNIPALRDNEPFVGSVSSYRGGVQFELTSTDYIKMGGGIKYFANSWEDVSKEIFKMDGFGNELDKSSYFKDELAQILAASKNDFQKVGAIFQFVKSKVKWNEYYGKTIDKGVRKAYKEGVGNVADINLMLTAMLREAGLNANPVLISTRNNGIPLFPTLDGFNYVISMVEFVDGTYVLLDATEPYSLPNILPVRDLNWNGRKVTKEGESSWVKLTSNKPAIQENFLSVKIKEDFVVEGLARTKFENLDAVNYRINNNHLKDESVISGLETKYGIEVDNFKVLNKAKLGKPINRIAKFVGEDLVEGISGKLYIKPLLFLAINQNPFKLEERKFPVDFGTPWKELNNVSIQIPDGYRVESLPETMAVAMPENLGVFKYQVIQKGNKITTISVLEFNDALIGYQYYPILKKFYGDIVAKQTQKIVLVKI